MGRAKVRRRWSESPNRNTFLGLKRHCGYRRTKINGAEENLTLGELQIPVREVLKLIKAKKEINLLSYLHAFCGITRQKTALELKIPIQAVWGNRREFWNESYLFLTPMNTESGVLEAYGNTCRIPNPT